MNTSPNTPSRPTAPQQPQPAPFFAAQHPGHPAPAQHAPRFGGPPSSGPMPAGPAQSPYLRQHGDAGGNGLPPYVGPRPEPRQPWWQRDGVVSKLLALTGVGVTLVGVVMMLVIAAQAGVLTPWVRVAGGLVLSVALIGAGLRVQGRPGGRIGGISLAATGIAGLFMCTVAATTFYRWLPSVAGLAVAGVIAAAAVWLAMRWRSQLLAVVVTVAVAALAPVLTGGLTTTLVWFLILLQAAGIVPERVRGWARLSLVRTVPAVLAALAVAARMMPFVGDVHRAGVQHAASPAVVAALGLASMLTARRGRVEAAGAALLAYLPLVVIVASLERPMALLVGATAALVTVAAAVIRRPLMIEQSVVIALNASLLVLTAVVSFTIGEWLPVILMAIALALVIVARQVQNPVAAVAGLGFGVLAVIAFVLHVDVRALVDADIAVDELTLPVVIGAVLLAVWAPFAALTLQRITRSADSRPWLVGAGFVGLYGVTLAILAVGTATSGTVGFHTGQFGVTVTWMALAMGLLTLGLQAPSYAKIGILGGLMLSGAALAKLFLFDLATLDGMTRAATFIAVGLLLLFAGSRYAQLFARRRAEGSSESDDSAPHGPLPAL